MIFDDFFFFFALERFATLTNNYYGNFIDLRVSIKFVSFISNQLIGSIGLLWSTLLHRFKNISWNILLNQWTIYRACHSFVLFLEKKNQKLLRHRNKYPSWNTMLVHSSIDWGSTLKFRVHHFILTLKKRFFEKKKHIALKQIAYQFRSGNHWIMKKKKL